MDSPSPSPPIIRASRVQWLWLCWLGLGLLVAGVLAILTLFDPAGQAFYPRCYFKAFTGYDCPGCGGLRAAHQVLHGHLRAAFALNPLLFVVGPVGVYLALAEWLRRRTGRTWLQPFRHPAWLWALLASVVAFTILRNLPLGTLLAGGR